MRKGIKDIKEILEEVGEKLKKLYGENLRGIILYGSYARGEATEDSDIDLIILLKDMEDISKEWERYFPIIYEIAFRNDVVISVVPLKERDYYSKNHPFLLNAKKEGIKI
jgi:predicted nucleotidyltransferase